MQSGWFYSQNAVVVVLALVGVMLLASEIGCRIGMRRHAKASDNGRWHFRSVMASMLGLVALLLGFTFNLAAERYAARRQLVIADADALGTLYTRAGMMPEQQRKAFKGLLRQYIDLRTSSGLRSTELTRGKLEELAAQTNGLHRQMWGLVRSMTQDTPPVAGMDAALTLLDKAQSVNRHRFYAHLERVPESIIWLLLGATAIVMGTVGLSGGMGQYRGLTARLLLALLLSGTIYVILDMDQPQLGYTQVDQSPLLQLRNVINHDPEAM